MNHGILLSIILYINMFDHKKKFSVEASIKNNVYGAIKYLNLSELNSLKYFYSNSINEATNPVNIIDFSKI